MNNAHTHAGRGGLPESTQQVVFPEAGRVELDRATVPAPGPGEMIIAVRRVGICATDVHLLDGHIGDPFPLVPGHEFVGEVAGLGEGTATLRGLAVGQRVAVEMLLPCRSCARCREGRYNLCLRDDAGAYGTGRQLGVNIPRTQGAGLNGGYAGHLLVPAEAVAHALPADVDWDVLALVEPLAVAFRALHRGRVAAGERVAVVGPGPVGLLACAAARSAGASVALVGTRATRLTLGRRLGADHTLDSTAVDAEEALRQLWPGGADVVIETAGVPAAQEQAVRLARRGGRVVLAGACGSGVPVTFRQDEELLLKEVDLLPSFLSAGGFEPAIALLGRQQFPFEELVTHRFSLPQVAEALDVVRHKRDGVLKALLVP